MPRLLSDADEAHVAALLSRLTLRDKLGQMWQPSYRALRPSRGAAQKAVSQFASLVGQSDSDSLVGRAAGSNFAKDDKRPLSAASAAPVTAHRLGSVLADGGGFPEPNTAAAWREQSENLQAAAAATPCGVPLLIGNDSVHGQNNLRDATLFPHHIGQGCMRDAEGRPDAKRVRALAAVAARESYACGINWIFSPCVAVPHDLRWGRTFEGFSEDVDVVSALGAAEVEGLQSEGFPMAATLKHWVADGGTAYGSGTHDFIWSGAPGGVLDQGDARLSEAELRESHVAGYRAAIEAGALTVMASYSSWNGAKVHSSGQLLTRLLKEELGFDGLLVSDYNAVNHCAKAFGDAFALAINAGIDMVMTAAGLLGDIPYPRQLALAQAEVERGAVPLSRVDDAVRRILRVKVACGVLAGASGTPSKPPLSAEEEARLRGCVGCAAHRATARDAVRASAVLLKNERCALPLPRFSASAAEAEAEAEAEGGLVVVGKAADDLGMQCGGWTIEWQGVGGKGFTAGTTVFEAVRNANPAATLLSAEEVFFRFLPDWGNVAGRFRSEVGKASTVLVVVGEAPYAEGCGDVRELAMRSEDVDLIRAVAGGPAERADRRVVVLLLSGRPLVIPPDVLELIDALVAGWLPGTEGGGLADVLFGEVDFSGKLGYAWPRSGDQMSKAARDRDPLWPRGHGLQLGPAPSSELLAQPGRWRVGDR